MYLSKTLSQLLSTGEKLLTVSGKASKQTNHFLAATLRYCAFCRKPIFPKGQYMKKYQHHTAGADPGFLEKGVHMYKVWGFALLILSHFS